MWKFFGVSEKDTTLGVFNRQSKSKLWGNQHSKVQNKKPTQTQHSHPTSVCASRRQLQANGLLYLPWFFGKNKQSNYEEIYGIPASGWAAVLWRMEASEIWWITSTQSKRYQHVLFFKRCMTGIIYSCLMSQTAWTKRILKQESVLKLIFGHLMQTICQLTFLCVDNDFKQLWL